MGSVKNNNATDTLGEVNKMGNKLLSFVKQGTPLFSSLTTSSIKPPTSFDKYQFLLYIHGQSRLWVRPYIPACSWQERALLHTTRNARTIKDACSRFGVIWFSVKQMLISACRVLPHFNTWHAKLRWR